MSDYGYPYRPPLPADGERARSQRGPVGDGWWARRFVRTVEEGAADSRLARGRRYARSGQVLSVEIEEGLVRGRVQGSRRTPYLVEIRVKTRSGEEWERIEQVLASQARFMIALLGGELPFTVEEELKERDLALLPKSIAELDFICSCPDYAHPCKHAAALLYIFAERVDDDPFALFRLRGREQETLLSRLRELRAEGVESAGESPEKAVEPLSPVTFWDARVPADVSFDFADESVERDLFHHLPRIRRGEFASLKAAYGVAKRRARHRHDDGSAAADVEDATA